VCICLRPDTVIIVWCSHCVLIYCCWPVTDPSHCDPFHWWVLSHWLTDWARLVQSHLLFIHCWYLFCVDWLIVMFIHCAICWSFVLICCPNWHYNSLIIWLFVCCDDYFPGDIEGVMVLIHYLLLFVFCGICVGCYLLTDIIPHDTVIWPFIYYCIWWFLMTFDLFVAVTPLLVFVDLWHYLLIPICVDGPSSLTFVVPILLLSSIYSMFIYIWLICLLTIH